MRHVLAHLVYTIANQTCFSSTDKALGHFPASMLSLTILRNMRARSSDMFNSFWLASSTKDTRHVPCRSCTHPKQPALPKDRGSLMPNCTQIDEVRFAYLRPT
jgi:hypothetical protein